MLLQILDERGYSLELAGFGPLLDLARPPSELDGAELACGGFDGMGCPDRGFPITVFDTAGELGESSRSLVGKDGGHILHEARTAPFVQSTQSCLGFSPVCGFSHDGVCVVPSDSHVSLKPVPRTVTTRADDPAFLSFPRSRAM